MKKNSFINIGPFSLPNPKNNTIFGLHLYKKDYDITIRLYVYTF